MPKLPIQYLEMVPPLVIPPPWVTSLRFVIEDPFMNQFLEQLAQKVTVVFYDKHGCGQSDRDREEFTLESELLDLETVVNHLGLDKFNLLGSSMSGPISIAFTARYPNRVSRLVLYGTYANGKKLAKKKVQLAIISLTRSILGPWLQNPRRYVHPRCECRGSSKSCQISATIIQF